MRRLLLWIVTSSLSTHLECAAAALNVYSAIGSLMSDYSVEQHRHEPTTKVRCGLGAGDKPAIIRSVVISPEADGRCHQFDLCQVLPAFCMSIFLSFMNPWGNCFSPFSQYKEWVQQLAFLNPSAFFGTLENVFLLICLSLPVHGAGLVCGE